MFLKKVVIICIIFICLFVSSVYAKSFTDVPETHWAYKYVDDLSDKGIINGYNDGTFKPGNTIKNTEFLKMIVSAVYTDDEIDKMNEGKELKSWYDKYVNVAYDKGFTDTKWSEHDLNKPAFRLDIATTLYNVCSLLNIGIDYLDVKKFDITEDYDIETLKTALIELKLTTKKTLSDKEVKDAIKKLSKTNYSKFFNYLEQNASKKLFADTDKLTTKNKQKLSFIKDLKLINGYEDGSFKPYNKITRAEVATILSRYLSLSKEEAR